MTLPPIPICLVIYEIWYNLKMKLGIRVRPTPIALATRNFRVVPTPFVLTSGYLFHISSVVIFKFIQAVARCLQG
jgi:hypothetical protein